LNFIATNITSILHDLDWVGHIGTRRNSVGDGSRDGGVNLKGKLSVRVSKICFDQFLTLRKASKPGEGRRSLKFGKATKVEARLRGWKVNVKAGKLAYQSEEDADKAE
jgi:hypothetical protein